MVGLLRRSYQTHSTGGDTSSRTYRRGERRLKTGTHRDRDRRDDASGRAVHEIDAGLPKNRAQPHRVVDAPPAFVPVGRRYPHEDRDLLADGDANRGNDLAQESDPAVEVAAVLVGSVVRERREKLVNEISMSGVDLHYPETGHERAGRRGGERVDHRADLFGGKRAWRRRVGGERSRGRRDGLPGSTVNLERTLIFPWRGGRR